MRVALLASSFALFVASPAFAQCLYVACNGTTQQSHSATSSSHHSSSSYEEGFAAGKAAGTTTIHQHITQRIVRTPHRKAKTTPARTHRPHAKNVRRAHPARPVTRHVSRAHTHQSVHTYHDQIKDRAATYRPHRVGQSTILASSMSSSSSWSSSSSSTSWSGPTTIVHQGGQVCGWGERIVTSPHGHAQRHAAWVCQWPQGWRPPGY